jgi:glycosyltransferase involved in cell wall biosynthesis
VAGSRPGTSALAGRSVALKILHTVEFYSPSVGGAQEVVRRVSEVLARLGHDVTVATTRLPDRADGEVRGVRIEEFDVGGNAVRGLHGEVERYRRFVVDGDWDVVMTYAAQQWTMDALLPVVDDIRAARVLAPCGFSALLDPAYAGYFAELRTALHRYDHLIFHSDTYQDVEFARAAGVQRYSVVPNAADPAEFDAADGDGFRKRHRIGADTPLLLAVGSHTGIKGHGLVLDAVHRANLPRAVLVLIGNTVHGRGCLWNCRLRALALRLASHNHKRVVLLDPPRDEVAAAYWAADLFLLGSEIECSPLVLFEAMASATPFVSVDCGNAAEIAEWGEAGTVVPSPRRPDGRVAGDAGELARAVERLLADGGSRARMAEAGQEAVRKRFNWDAIAEEYERVYKTAMEGVAERAELEPDRP